MLIAHRPTSWEDAVVYDRRRQVQRVNKESRHALKVRERSGELCKTVQALCTRRLIGILRESVPHFHHLFPRPFQMEWLRYEPGMFFRPHQDFERYVCNGMIPYVLLIGLCDVEEGGETRVGDRMCAGSTSRNGAVFFPSNMMHEACPVLKGIKMCVKLDYFVFADEEPVIVRSEEGWKSFWTRPALSMVDNYIRCHQDFMRKADKLLVSEATARGLHNMMKQITIASGHNDPFHEMMFPNLPVAVLHDIFLTVSPDPIVLGRQSLAWDYLHRHRPGIYLVGLWEKETKQDRYTLSMIADRRGRLIKMDYLTKQLMMPQENMEEDDHFLPYPILRQRLVQTFIKNKELPSRPVPEKTWSIGQKEPTVWESTISRYWKELHDVQPSDNDSIKVEGEVHRREKEFCNDEESGYEIVEWTAYLSYRIQTRWIRLL